VIDYPSGQDEATFLHKKFPQKLHTKSFIGQACLVKIAGYWPHSFFFFASLRTSTPSWSPNTQKKNLANIQPYYTTQAVRGPIIKINQSKCSIAGPSIGPGIVPNDPAHLCLCSLCFLQSCTKSLINQA